MDNTKKATSVDPFEYLKVIIGIVVFLITAILLTSKSYLYSYNDRILILQCFLLGLVLMAVSIKGYYLDKPTDSAELPIKFFIFAIVLLPTALIFFVDESNQLLPK